MTLPWLLEEFSLLILLLCIQGDGNFSWDAHMKWSLPELLNEFRSSAYGSHHAAKIVRNKLDAEQQAHFLSQLKADEPRVEEALMGICFAKSWSDIYSKVPSASFSNAQTALNWHCLLASRFATELKAHIALRQQLINLVFAGSWEQASSTLEEHEKLIGPTLWLMSWKILIAEESQGAKYVAQILADYQHAQNGEVAPIFAKFYGLSADRSVPGEFFRKQIRACLPEDKATIAFFELLMVEESGLDWEVADMLHFSELLPLVDRFEFFCRLLIAALSKEHRDTVRILRATTKVGDLLQDDFLRHIAECFDDSLPIGRSQTAGQIMQVWDYYVTGNYKESLKMAKEMALSRPDLLPCHELLVKSALYLKTEEIYAGTSPIALFWQHLRDVFAKNANSENSLTYLRRLGRRYRIASLSYPLRALNEAHSASTQSRQYTRGAAFALGIHGPRNFEYGSSVDENIKYLARLDQGYPKSRAAFFFNSIYKASGPLVADCDDIPPIRHYFFAGISAMHTAQLQNARSYLTEFLRMQMSDVGNPLSPFAIEEARRCLVDVYRLEGDVVNMQKAVVQFYLDRPESIKRLPISKILQASTSNIGIASQNIEYPFIVYLACNEPHDIYIGLKRYLRAAGCDKPSDLIAKHPSADYQLLAIMFLMICTTEILDSVDVLDTVDKVEAERLALLSWVGKSMPGMARTAEAEQLRLTQTSQLRTVMQKMEGARIILNLAGLREAEREKFNNSFVRFAAQRDLSANRTADKIRKVNVIRASGQSSQLVVIEGDALASQHLDILKAFGVALQEVRDAFVYSVHFGIESCLSNRIRHGFVIQQIRKPFVEKNLAVSEDPTERAELRQYWQNRIPNLAIEQANKIIDVLAGMTREINGLAEQCRGVWFQSKTETRVTGGLFDYVFTEVEVEALYEKRFHDVGTPDTFVDRVFEVLLEKTRRNIKVVRNCINEKLRPALLDVVTQAIDKFLRVCEGGDNCLAIKSALIHCRHECERSCDQLLNWFQEGGASLMGDSSLDLVARTAVGMIEQLNPDFRGKHVVGEVSANNIRGRHFTTLAHILFFLVDNAIKHRDVPKEHFKSEVAIRTSGIMMCLSVTSVMASKKSAVLASQKIAKRLDDLSKGLDPVKVIKEGGSGFAKIVTAVQSQFKQGQQVIEVNVHESKLTVSVKFEVTGIIV